ncbi:PAS domain-containing protein [Pontibacter sp. H259]|uniref:PAS domain-containing protein n=1 Tax=Pontibacter sp. H259 TaxID=3133421 RepID=UPI0030C521BB
MAVKSSSEPGSTAFPTLLFNRVFEAQAGLQILLSPELTILAATDAFIQESMTVRDSIVGKSVFEVFPDNPVASDNPSSSILKNSFEQVLKTREPHKIEVFRYDIPDQNNPGIFLERYWVTSNVPVLDDKGQVLYIIHETSNVTGEVKAKQELFNSREREKRALAQAEQQRIRLERLFEQAPAAFAMLEGPDFVYRVLNNAYQQLFPGRKMLGLPLFEALPELRDQAVYDIIHTVYNTGETFEGKEVLIPIARYAGESAEDIYWNFIYQALYDADGQVNGILIFALDVTEFVAARQQVQKTADALHNFNRELERRVERRTHELRIAQAEALSQKQQLETLFMQAPSAICILNGPDFIFQLVNPVYQQIFPGRDILGKPLTVALPEVKGTAIPEILNRVYRTGEPYVAEDLPLMLARNEGGPLEQIYWTFTYQARRNGEGVIDGVLVFAHEVTNQVEARRAIEASAKQLQLVTDSLPVLISYIDKEEKYRFANRAYESWFNMKVEDVVNRPVQDVVGIKAYEKAKAYIHRALAGERLTYEAAMPYPKGLRHTRTTFIPDEREGQVAGFYALVLDSTEHVKSRKVLEKREQEAKAMAGKLANANQKLTHINADLDNFIYTASHDLKAPISNIEMLIEELLIELPTDSLTKDEVSVIINMIRGAVARFKNTISSLTEITRLQKDNQMSIATVSIADVVQEVMLDLDKLIRKTEAEISISVDGHTTSSFSQKNLRSIVYNFLSNSLKYKHPERKPEIKINSYVEANYLVLTVQDNGLGINDEQQTKLFTMFRRFHDHVEGSGVGLYMVKRMIDNAGGKIEVESQVNTGSLFKVYIPL